MKTFCLTGAAGYIAEKHMNAIKQNGGNLIGTFDPSCSVGVLDKYFPDCAHFTEFERFERYIDKNKPDYFVVCSPSYLHDSQSRFGLRNGCDVICEKPLAFHKRNIDRLIESEIKTGKNIYTVMQLRNHPVVDEIKQVLLDKTKKHHVLIEYYLPRGAWYNYSWHGDIEKSGGIYSNIGIHILDILCNILGKHKGVLGKQDSEDKTSCMISFENCIVDMSLSTKIKPEKRLMEVNGMPFNFDMNKTFDLHFYFYQNILSGDTSFSVKSVQLVTELIEEINTYGD